MSLQMGCTAERHRRIGVNAVINARAGLGDVLNSLTSEEIELQRDARAIAATKQRIRWYGPNSRFLRKHIGRIAHLISRHDD